jgi:hypothetical protein
LAHSLEPTRSRLVPDVVTWTVSQAAVERA